MEEIFNKRVFEDGFWNINEPKDNSVIIRKITDESVLPQYVRDNREKFEHHFA
jgi:DNA helicase HerA-like ATPase